MRTDFDPLNDLERRLLAAQAGRIPPESFIETRLGPEVLPCGHPFRVDLSVRVVAQGKDLVALAKLQAPGPFLAWAADDRPTRGHPGCYADASIASECSKLSPGFCPPRSPFPGGRISSASEGAALVAGPRGTWARVRVHWA